MHGPQLAVISGAILIPIYAVAASAAASVSRTAPALCPPGTDLDSAQLVAGGGDRVP